MKCLRVRIDSKKTEHVRGSIEYRLLLTNTRLAIQYSLKISTLNHNYSHYYFPVLDLVVLENILHET